MVLSCCISIIDGQLVRRSTIRSVVRSDELVEVVAVDFNYLSRKSLNICI